MVKSLAILLVIFSLFELPLYAKRNRFHDRHSKNSKKSSGGHISEKAKAKLKKMVEKNRVEHKKRIEDEYKVLSERTIGLHKESNSFYLKGRRLGLLALKCAYFSACDVTGLEKVLKSESEQLEQELKEFIAKFKAGRHHDISSTMVTLGMLSVYANNALSKSLKEVGCPANRIEQVKASGFAEFSVGGGMLIVLAGD